MIKLLSALFFVSFCAFSVEPEQKTQLESAESKRKSALISKQMQLIKVIAKGKSRQEERTHSAN